MENDLLGKRLLPDKIAAQELGLQVQTIRNWRSLGIGPPYIRVGTRAIRYDEDDLHRFIERGKVEPRG
jgi:DNA-binding transcriptional MerR regulator